MAPFDTSDTHLTRFLQVLNIISSTLVCVGEYSSLLLTQYRLTSEAVSHGFGRHTQDIAMQDRKLALKVRICHTFEDTHTDKLQYFYSYQIVYKTAITFTKFSFLVLYFRLFPSKRSQYLSWAMVAIVGLGAIAFVFGTVFQCMPIKRSWNKSVPGSCRFKIDS